MLYGNCLKVLKAINFLCRNAEETSTVDICVYLHNRIQNEDFLGCIHQLENDGLIEIRSETELLVSVAPTHKGRHYKEYRRRVIVEFILKSVLTPNSYRCCICYNPHHAFFPTISQITPNSSIPSREPTTPAIIETANSAVSFFVHSSQKNSHVIRQLSSHRFI